MCLPLQSDGVDLEEDSDKVTLIRNSGRQDAQKQSFMVSDEVAHIEERAMKMESLEVKLISFQNTELKKKAMAAYVLILTEHYAHRVILGS